MNAINLPSKLVIIFLVVVLSTLGSALLTSCGGDSDGDLIISGTLSSSTRDEFGGDHYIISALGDSTSVGLNSSFSLFADANSVPSQFILNILPPGAASQNFTINSAAQFPILLTIQRNSDGTFTVIQSSGEAPPAVDVPVDNGGEEELPPAVIPTVVGTVEPTIAPAPDFEPTTIPSPPDSGIDESFDCFCNDGFGPVAPSFTCADTGAHPTDCSPPATPSAG